MRLSAGDTARVPSAVQSQLYIRAVLVTRLECMESRYLHEQACTKVTYHGDVLQASTSWAWTTSSWLGSTSRRASETAGGATLDAYSDCRGVARERASIRSTHEAISTVSSSEVRLVWVQRLAGPSSLGSLSPSLRRPPTCNFASSPSTNLSQSGRSTWTALATYVARGQSTTQSCIITLRPSVFTVMVRRIWSCR